MLSFDRLSAAAVTPGGFQNGVNDIIQALLAKKQGDAKMAQQQEQQGWDRNMQTQQLELQRQGMGSKVADQLADQKYRDSTLDISRQRLDLDRQRAATQNGPDSARPLTALEQSNLDEQETNLEMFGVPDIGKGVPSEQEVPELSPWGVPTGRNTKKAYNRPLSPQEIRLKNEKLAQRRQATGNGAPGKGASIIQALTPANSGSPTDGMSAKDQGSMGSQIAGGMGAKPPIDYDSEDAKLQATDPQYRQMRSNPRFNWKAAIDATKAQGQ